MPTCVCRRDAGAQLHVRGAAEHERSGQRYSAARRAWLRDSVSWHVAHGDGGATADTSALLTHGAARATRGESVYNVGVWVEPRVRHCCARAGLQWWGIDGVVAVVCRALCTQDVLFAQRRGGLHLVSPRSAPLVRGPIEASLPFYKRVYVA